MQRKVSKWVKVTAGDRKIITRIGLHIADLAAERANDNESKDYPAFIVSAIAGKAYRKYTENLNL